MAPPQVEVQLLKCVNLQSIDTLLSFDVVSVFTNVPFDEVPQIMSDKLYNDEATYH
jgi:hypothetical protein